MSGLSQAVPLALAAAVYPPAIIVCGLLLTGDRPRVLITSYFLGAAAITVSVGIAGLAVLQGTGISATSSRTTSAAADIAVGVVLLGAAAWAWPRRHREAAPKDDAGPGRVARLSQRALANARWAFALGIVMYLPSPLYLAAIKQIADTGGVTGGNVVAILICAACVLLFVEIPLVLLFLVPDGLEERLDRLQAAIARNGWAVAAGLAALAGVYLVVRGVAKLA